MAKQGQRAEINTFIQGLITEASPLNFPPNASKLEENFELRRDGTRKRRLGMDYEQGLGIHDCPGLDSAGREPSMSRFIWETVAGKPGQDFLVVQVANQLDIYDINKRPISANGSVVNSIPLGSGDVKYSMASVDGYLVVATNSNLIYLISYIGNTLFKVENITLRVRDFWGVDTLNPKLENDVYFRPSEITPQHAYNLSNQSWAIPRKNQDDTLVDPMDVYVGVNNVYPSNSEVVWTGLQYQAAASTKDVEQKPFERLYGNLYADVFGLAPVAAKGYFIIDALARGPSRKAAFNENFERFNKITYPESYFNPPADTSPGGPSSVASYAGRVFYSGFSGEVQSGDSRSPNLSNYILFSQLVRNKTDIAKCYQEGDPTSRDGSDLVDTDGGMVKIAGANRILALRELGTALIVIADNGIWSLSGGSDYGFTATNYMVTQVSNFGCTSADSIVIQGDVLLYWGVGGIYSMGKDKLGSLIVQNITKTTIQKTYDHIEKNRRSDVVGEYDERAKKVRWLYKIGNLFTDTSMTGELILDVDIGAFSIYRIMPAPALSIEVMLPFYTDGEMFYLTYIRTGLERNVYTFSQYSDSTYADWRTTDGKGVDAKAFVWTGDQIAGDSAIYKQAPYIVVHMHRTETGADVFGVLQNQSSCLMQAYWDWSSSVASNKVTGTQQVYRYRRTHFANPGQDFFPGYDIISTKSKIRGRGRAVSLYFQTEPGKDCHLLGWNVTLNGNENA